MIRGETRAKMSGLYKQAKQAKTYIALVCSEDPFGPSEAVINFCKAKPPLLVQPCCSSVSFGKGCRP